MAGMDILGIAQQGLDQAQGQFEQAARQVTRATIPASQPDDSLSLSDAAVALLSAKNQFAADINLAKTADEMQKATLNLLA